jgi:hypothetical protein
LTSYLNFVGQFCEQVSGPVMFTPLSQAVHHLLLHLGLWGGHLIRPSGPSQAALLLLLHGRHPCHLTALPRQAEDYLSDLNSMEQSILLSMEMESDRRLPFLNLGVLESDRHLPFLNLGV